MNGQDSKAEIFDVFLCHNKKDKPEIREISKSLVKEGIKPWFDEEQIRPGTLWQTALEEQIKNIKSAAVFVGESGLGPWQDQEIQALLDRFVKRKCAVVPVVLASTKAMPEFPWPLDNLHHVDFRSDTYPLKRLIWGITGKKPQEFVDAASSEQPATMQEAAKSRLVSGKARFHQPLAVAPNEEQANQLKILRDRVMEYWVDGFLKDSLYNEVLISLGKRQIDKAIDAPWKYTVEVSDAMNSAPLDERDVKTIYDATGSLLILGEPGSGKTTTLLDLAQTLLERARNDIKERVPVILNLSSWKKKQPIAEWIVDELWEKYWVPVKIARLWLQRGYLLPLLDGLDEIETSMQPDCVAVINAFIEESIKESKPTGLVVCCRLNEYRWLPERLKLNGAICIEPLSPDEVSKYLAAGGAKLAALREALETDPVLHELAQTPLMLSIMSLAYQGARGDELATQEGDSLNERRKQIFNLYVEQMFQRKWKSSLVFPKEKVIGWLSWLAGKMREHSQSVFLVEGLQPSWLDTRIKRIAYRINRTLRTTLIFGLLCGLIVGLIVGPSVGLIAGLIAGLILGLYDAVFYWFFRLIGGSEAVSLGKIVLVETINWKWNQFWKATFPGSILGIILWLVTGLYFGLSFGLIGGLIGGLISTLLIGLTKGLVFGFTNSVKVGKASPNQGVKLSLKNSAVVFLVSSLTIGLSGGLIVGLLVGLIRGFGLGVSYGLMVGLIPGLVGGLNRGGLAVIDHYTLRLTLWLNGDTPFRFVKFLDRCAKLILLKKVGGGYIFIHRMLLDYFADLTPKSTKGGDWKTGFARP